jgi:RHS repeat-associated protein
MTTDPHKGITIQYNYLNLPSTVTFPNSDQLQIIYNANGKLLKRIYQQGANTTTKEYRGKFEFENNILSAYNHDEGRLTPKTGGGYNLEYYLKDHLFSNRIIFADMNVNGSINAATKILEENTYYPYGLEQSGLMNTISSNASPYQYSGKEMLTFNGYNMNDYGARYYDAALGRWNVMDELSEKYHSFSCYNFVVNNPMKYVDPNGKELMLHGGATEMNKFAAIMNKKLGSNMVVVTNGKVTLNGNSSKLKGGALSLYNSLNGVITNEKTTDVILLSEANRSKAFGGGWNKGEINSKSVNIVDVYDAEALDNAKVKLSGAGLLLHEIIETFEHQVNGENDFKKAHSIALKSQGDVDDVSNLENEAIDYNKDNIVDKIESTFTFAGTTWTVTYKFEKNNIVGATISYKPLPIIDKPKEKYVSKNNPLWR